MKYLNIWYKKHRTEVKSKFRHCPLYTVGRAEKNKFWIMEFILIVAVWSRQNLFTKVVNFFTFNYDGMIDHLVI